jgi:predicted HTH transcriptional regulator
VIRTDDRKNYIEALHQCDLAVGKIPSDGANAEMKQIEPLFQYIANIVERKLTFAIQLAKGEIREIVETNETADEHTLLLSDLQKNIILLMLENQKITYADMATKLNTTPRTLSKNIARLRELKFIGRRGSHRLGEWVVLKSV